MVTKVEALSPLRSFAPGDFAAPSRNSTQFHLRKLRSVVGGHTRQSIYDRLAGGLPKLPERKRLQGAREIAEYTGKKVRKTFDLLAASLLPAKKDGGSYFVFSSTLDVFFMLEDAYVFNQFAFVSEERAKFSGLFLLLNGPVEPTMDQVIWSLQDVGFCLTD